MEVVPGRMVSEARLSHPAKATSPMVRIRAGMVSEVKEHSKKAISPIAVTLSGIALNTEIGSEVQFSKPVTSVKEALFGHVTSVSEAQQPNAPWPMDVRLSGSTIEVIAADEKALPPIVSTLLPNVTEASDGVNTTVPVDSSVSPQLPNAQKPMLVTLSGIVTAASFDSAKA